ncbi:probable LRR receptor-like serine/threonine-protein kinase At3g47570 [Pyrus x bretschneideri]|uniref:probable LRR receptor-like serine/threonine-protein kinase At3g47570 n=1 Tax=Pyrus x bretschneideri TaxID=225117 RepID=UPI00202F9A63|nr:probable LRR receptor-like serine/threonine-protein kinase At3g47570 [Pyrus x bretschneideri]
MEISYTYCANLLFKFLPGLFLLCMITCPESTFGNKSDRLALLDFKRRITEDPLRIMNSWNDSVDLCSWVGVTCNHANKRVMILNLEAQKLVGSVPPSIGNLTHLTGINLIDNNFHGEIPQEIGRLLGLQYLNLSSNSFGGKIPANISHCTQLRMLDVGVNKLIGSIPNQLNSLLNLTHFWVDENNLTGAIPDWIGNFSFLYALSLAKNNFEGSIPNAFGRLTSLGTFVIPGNKLSGTVPSSIYNISSLYYITFTQNQLQGELPQNVGTTLPNLEIFSGGINKLTGSIPVSLSNTSKLRILDFAENGLTGKFPAESFGTLKGLVRLNFDDNRLGSGKTGDLSSLSFLANCTNLEVLSFSRNRFGGELPESIGNLSTKLRIFTMGGNLLHGSIPTGVVNLVNLTNLGMEQNYLGGSVPDVIGKLQKLQGLYLNLNQFSGTIPSTLGNLTSVTRLFMEGNRFEGSIPPSLGNCQNLLMLNLSSNQLSGTIPKEVIGLSSLSISLSMSNNSLTGSLPSEVGELVHLSELDVSGNKLSGEIPITLGSCASLVSLHLEGNQFEGTIPQSLANLRGLEEIDISRNNLSGQIPEFLGKLRALKQLNISHNEFEGELPTEGIFSNASGFSVLGNNKLCGGIRDLRLHVCTSKSQGLLSPKVMIPLTCAVALIITLSCFIAACALVKRSRGRPLTSRSNEESKLGVSYLQLVESTNGFSPENLIGSGSFGSVYRGVLSGNGMIVAIKVLNLQQEGASKSFIDECKALRSVRHRNLLKIITACSSIDMQGNDFKSLVYEFMENGSLDTWLHPRDDEQSPNKRLSLTQRLNIAIDVAFALDYLHHNCETCIVHCDLKPSNILLDEDMVAHVGDFGLAKFLLEASNGTTLSVGLKGSIGYIPPEYGMGGLVSTQGDVYSYGILLLEMFTGKRPTDEIFKDGLSIHEFTAMALPDHVKEVVEPSLLLETDDEDDDGDGYGNKIQERSLARYKDPGPDKAKRLEECLYSVIQIGISCSTISPGERMLMHVVVNKMGAIRDSYLNLRRRR